MRIRRTAVLVRCTKEEAAAIRWAARRERRTISAFILNAVDLRIQAHRNILASFSEEEAGAAPASETRTDFGNQTEASAGRHSRQSENRPE